MKKIALFMPTASDGGVQRVLINLAKGFLPLGYQVDMVLANSTGKMISQIPAQCNIIDLNQSIGRGDLLPILSLLKLRKYIKNEKPNVLVASPGFSTVVSVWAKLLTNNKDTKFILMVDNKVSLLKNGRWYHKFTLLMMKIFYKYADVVVTAHKSAENDIKKTINIDEKKVKMVYHPLIEEKQSYFQKPELLKMHKDEKIILGVGRLVKEKDFVSLVKAFKKVSNKISSKLIIIGEGPERENIEETIKELGLENKVEIPGYVSDPYSYMKYSNVLVVSSTAEAFGNVIVEALSVGTPIVATNCESGGPAEILNNGEYGILCNYGDIEGLSNAIIQSLTTSYSTSTSIERSRKFTIKESVRKYEEIFNEE